MHRQSPHRDFAAVRVQDLNKATHMGPFELVRKIDGHGQPGDGGLTLILPIEHDDGIPKIADSHLIDGDLAVVRLALNVEHQSNPPFRPCRCNRCACFLAPPPCSDRVATASAAAKSNAQCFRLSGSRVPRPH